MKRALSILLVGLMVAFFATITTSIGNADNADIVTLTDKNSSASIDPDSQAGMVNWTTDGVNNLSQQWFWYRIGATGGQSSIDTISAPGVTVTSRILDLMYSNAALSVEITYTLTGGTAGSGTSDIAETIRIINTSTSAYTLHFFQYSDFDLAGNAAGDTVLLKNANTVDQTGAGKNVSETVVTPSPNKYEMNFFPNTLNSLNSGSPYTLQNIASSGPGDVTWALEWDVDFAPDATLIISKDKHLSAAPVPVPPSVLLLGSGLIGLGAVSGLRRKRQG